MKKTTLALALLAGFGAGCTTVPSAPLAIGNMPNCYDSNYDGQLGLFTMRNAPEDAVNQQCLLTVGPGGRLAAGSYTAYLSNGGGGGAGGTGVQAFRGEGGGGGGGGAGAAETQTRVYLAEGVYKLTLGAGGPGGARCVIRPFAFGGGPGWVGSPTNMVRVSTGEVLAGPAGADTYVRLTRSENERQAGTKRDGHGGSGPGQTRGGDGGVIATAGRAKEEAEAGASARANAGGAAGVGDRRDVHAASGGGGGSTSRGDGGAGGGDAFRRAEQPPQRGSLGSGGGGGEGDSQGCDAGARGGHGFIALRAL